MFRSPPLTNHPDTLSLVQALASRQKRQKEWMSALERDTAQIHKEGMETE